MPVSTLLSKTQKPPFGPLKLDFGHPLAQGLVGFFALNEFGNQVVFDLLAGVAPSLAGGATWDSRSGRSGLLTNAAGALATVATPTRLQLQLPISIVWRGAYLGGQDANAFIFGSSYSNNDTNPYVCYNLDFDGSSNIRLGWNNGSTQTINSAAPATGQLWLGGTLAAASQALYINDPFTAAATASVAGASISYGATTQITFGGYAGVSRNAAVLHEVGHVYNRVLSTAELAWLKAEPYSMIQTQPLRRWAPAAAAAFDPATVPWQTDTPIAPGLAVVGF